MYMSLSQCDLYSYVITYLLVKKDFRQFCALLEYFNIIIILQKKY